MQVLLVAYAHVLCRFAILAGPLTNWYEVYFVPVHSRLSIHHPQAVIVITAVYDEDVEQIVALLLKNHL